MVFFFVVVVFLLLLFFFSNAVATRNGLLVKPAIELLPLPCSAHFRARREPGTIPLVLTYHPTNALVNNIITRNLYLVRDDRETAAIFQPLRILCAYRRYSNLRDCPVRSALDNTRAISIWISLWLFEVRENEGRERGCRQSLYRCTKNFWQRRWKTYTRYLTLTQNIHLVLCNTPKTLEPQ